MVLTEVPPPIVPTLNVVLGSLGTAMAAMCWIAAASALAGLTMPNAL